MWTELSKSRPILQKASSFCAAGVPSNFFEFFAYHSSVQNQFSNENESALQRHKNDFDIRCASALSQEFMLFSCEAYFLELRFD